MTIAQCYAREGNAFGIKGPFYGPAGHRGQDYYVSGAGAHIIAYESGFVRLIQYSKYLGWVVVIESAKDGAFLGWAHVKNIRYRVGQWAEAGRPIAEAAGANDDPGISWDGPHIHTTRGPNKYSIFEGTTWDPRFNINLAKKASAPAGTPGTPVPIVVPETRRNHMWVTWTTDGTGWLVTPQGWHGLPSMQVYSLFARLIKSTPDKTDTFLRAEVDIMASHQRIIAVAASHGTQIDADKLASAISDALGKTLTIDADIDPEELARAMDTVVPRVSNAIVKQFGQKLTVE